MEPANCCLSNGSKEEGEGVGDGDRVVDGVAFKLSLVLALSSSLSTLGLYSAVLFKKAELTHPVFAALLQETVVLTSAGAACLLSLLVCMAEDMGFWVMWILRSSCLLMLQFHQVTWLVITALRYYLIVCKERDSDVDMASLRRKALLSVWASYLPCLLLSGLTVLLQKRLFDNSGAEATRAKFYAMGSFVLAGNLPDLVSLTIYLKMLLWVRKKKSQIDVANQVPSENGSLGLQPAADGTPDLPDPPNQADHEMVGVLRALTTHALVALLDLALPCAVLVPHRGARVFLVAHCLVGFALWIPAMVVRANFRQMDQMVKLYFDLLC